jgi:nucleotide-binding universal stress UspA family protein
MYSLKRIVVGLDLSALDETIIKYAAFIAKNITADKIYFVHISRNLELPDEVLQKYPDLIAPVDETIVKEIEESLKKHFEPDYIKDSIEIKVSEGNAFEKLLKWIKIKEADLVVMGLKKSKGKEEGLLPRKITNIAPCSVLLVPEEAEAKVAKISVPVDFSKYSNLAVSTAVFIANKIENCQIFCQHIYTVPTGYHYTGKSYEDFAEIMKNNAAKHFETFHRKFRVSEEKLHCEFELDRNDNTSKAIHDLAIKHNSDLIVVGSRGRTGAASILLGSIAEKLINCDQKIPLLIVKRKGDNMTFLKALFEI